MSNRTKEASKAVRAAWAQEAELIKEGCGSRDWTPEQQQDIVMGDVPTDEYGRPFEGHHMKSVEAYPEEQGNENNIQFLTRDEHLAAHHGSFQNKTAAYYDPQTGTETAQGNEVEPPPVQNLSNPTELEDDEEEDMKMNDEETEDPAEDLSVSEDNGIDL